MSQGDFFILKSCLFIKILYTYIFIVSIVVYKMDERIDEMLYDDHQIVSDLWLNILIDVVQKGKHIVRLIFDFIH